MIVRKYKKFFVLVLFCLSISFLFNCVAQNDRMLKLEQEITEVQRQLLQLQQADEQKKAILNQLVQKLDVMLKTITRSNADMSTEVSSLLTEIRAVQGELENNAQKINILMNHLNAISGSTGTLSTYAEITPTANPVLSYQTIPPFEGTAQSTELRFDEDKLYQNAYKNYLSGKYSFAIEGFKNFLQNFPNSSLADNAQYWSGECYYSQDQFHQALDEFYQLTQKYPTGDKVPAAMLKIGLCYLELQRPKQAKDVFDQLIHLYPTSNEAIQANEKLKLLE
ncbi:MAG: tol-pal system protein YbgF [Candidatus Schekmanbacteria bacterium RBG_13_48_7]|uniref:Tol-pal system protein YbgF n=1 Tax=Candidatus Schekmanbacteria bacterium RBG_13_48_7 TaxID=1817878 RepID=A0A1F7S4L7_9BACT|nr:MAG: tol-pal system protein YbgF [Candidatus Schekmanbacteria bacterium RBG_13_48_7]